MMFTFTPLGVASEYSCSGCWPSGSAFSSRAPAVGALMLANLPPDGASWVQTFGGT